MTVFGNDVVNYILHKSTYNSPLPGQVIDTFFILNELICFNPKTMKYGTNNPVYVTRVVGEDINPKDGFVDAKDPCKKASNNFKIIFEPNVLIDAGEDKNVCGLSYWLQGNISLMKTEWKQLSGIGKAIFSNPEDPNSYVEVDLHGKYCFELSSFSSCGLTRDTICLKFNDSPEFIRPSAKIICHESKNQYKINVELHKGDPLTRSIKAFHSISKKRIDGNFDSAKESWESNWLNNNQNITLQLKDTNDCNLDILRVRSSCVIKSKADTIRTDTSMLARSHFNENSTDSNLSSIMSDLSDRDVLKITHVEMVNLSGQRVLIANNDLALDQFIELIDSQKVCLEQGLYIILIEYKLSHLKPIQTTRELIYLSGE